MRLEAHIRLPQGLKKTDFDFFSSVVYNGLPQRSYDHSDYCNLSYSDGRRSSVDLFYRCSRYQHFRGDIEVKPTENSFSLEQLTTMSSYTFFIFLTKSWYAPAEIKAGIISKETAVSIIDTWISSCGTAELSVAWSRIQIVDIIYTVNEVDYADPGKFYVLAGISRESYM